MQIGQTAKVGSGGERGRVRETNPGVMTGDNSKQIYSGQALDFA